MARPPKLDARRRYGNDRPLFGWRRRGGGGGGGCSDRVF